MGPADVRLNRGAGRSMLAALVSLAVLGGALLSAAPAIAADDPPSTSPARLASSRALTPGSGPVSVAVIVPITVPNSADGTGVLDAATLATDTAPTGVLTRQLNAVTGTAAVLAIDPMIVVSIRLLGTAVPASAYAWLQALQALPNEKFPLAYADADPGVLAHASGGAALLNGLDFQPLLDTSHFGPAVSPSASASASAPASASPTPAATSPTAKTPLPTDDALLAAPGDYVADDIAWPAAGTVSAADLAPLAAAGYHTVLLGSGNVSSAASARVRLDGMDGIVSDDGLSAIARETVDALGDTALQEALTRFDAALDGMQAVSPGRSVIATLDRGWSVSALHVRELLQNIDAQSSAQSVGLSAVLTGPAVDAKVVDGTIPADGAGLLDAVVATVPQVAAFATAAGDASATITSPHRLELLSTMSVAWVESDTGWADRLSTFLASTTATLDAVKIVHGSGVLVTASQTTIPVTVSNALTVPVTVDVTVTPGSPLLRVSKRNIQLKVEPGATGRVLVPAQALSTARLDAVGVELHSAASPTVQIGTGDTLTVDMRPSYEGIGTGIVITLLVLIFGGGIVRQVLRRRRARTAREAAASDAVADPATDTGERV